MQSLKKCISVVEKSCISIPPGDPYFSDRHIKTHPLDKNNVHALSAREPERRVAFVDGGDNTIASAPNFVVSLVRVYYNVYRGSIKLKPATVPSRIDFFATVTTSITAAGEVEYITTITPLDPAYSAWVPDEPSLRLKANDPTLMKGGFPAIPGSVISAARLFAEWLLAAFVIEKELDEGDVIVRDGTLQTSITNEWRFAKRAFDAALAKKVIMTGFAKSSALLTTTGNSLSKVVKNLGDGVYPKAPWYYHPIADITLPDHRAEMFLIKPHELARTAYRFEIFRDQAKAMTQGQIESVLASIAANSRDISLPGYPYGLVDADMFARVAGQEIKYYAALFASLSQQQQGLAQLQAAVDTHAAMDQSRFESKKVI
ncbi:MAG: DNA double-strand break repair nuclease NurA [Candidatus Sigynarchaeota archaeon]